ncbi:little elongation complex subunit 1 isoform X2 [Tympanuchus pallidicinctus]|uniref:little elongation complex subunit 1 isoform X2 n=1 Tax=Tympanuchus pallidicinctus TaxID=109042 RepID=UPI002286E066|nr:little elongation complex subunit 1 isoform X2 [Tympanuchus pallidicinctus]
MMPGETQPPPAGTAAAVPCKNCAVLQQNINEYVAALVALKQKMIHGDRLLTEYQQKCTELQFAEREISALRCQVEQMLQKILPLEKDQKELGSLKAELEEKKSSLKIYQESQLECVRLKEEIVRSDAVRKKLEAKVKKLEEAATKHTQDFKQLKIEKKKLEKELKKAQGKLDGVPKEKCRKVKHAETQSTNEVLAADIDKEKIKFLLEELWMCIDSAKEKGEKQENDPILVSAQDKAWPGKRRLSVTKETVQTHQKNGKHGGKTLPWHSSIESAGKQNSVTALQQVDTEPLGSDCLENRTINYLQDCEDKTRDVIVQRDGTHSSSALSDQEQKGQGGNVMDILNWVRPLPALLSPVRLSPVATQDTLFGELTGSSDEEMDCIASAEECILQEDQVQSQNCCNVFKQNEECNRWNKPREHSVDTEISYNLSRTEKIVHISPATLIKEERNTKQCEVATSVTNIESNRDCLENSENMEAVKRDLMEATACELEAEEEQKGDIKEMHEEEKASSIHSVLHSFNLQNQIERSGEVEQAEENAILVRAGGCNSAHEKYGELMKAEHEREIPKAVTIPQNVTNLPPEQYHVVLQRKDSVEKSGMLIESEVVENECKDAIKMTNTVINVEENIKQVVSGEEATATIQTQGLCAEPNNGRELFENVLYNFSSSKSSCEAKCPEDLIIQHDGEGIVMETDVCTESTVHSQCSEIRHDSEKILEKQCKHTLKCEIVRKCELETPEVSQCYSPVSAVEGVEHSLYMDDTDKKACVMESASLAFPEDDGQFKIQDKNIIRPKSVEQTVKLNKESVLEIAESSELLPSAENGKLLYEKEREGLEGKNHQEESFSHFFQEKSDLESIPAVPKMACVTDAESSVAKCESFVLDSTERNGEINQPENLCSTTECELPKTQNFGVIESQESEFKVNQEDFIGDSSKLLEKVDTIQSVLVESNLTSQTQFAEPQNQFLMTTDAKCDETKAELHKQSKELIEACPSLFKEEKNVVKKNNVSEIIQEPSSEMDFNSGFALCSQMDLKTDCMNSKETGSPIQVRNGLESTVPGGLNFSLQKVVRVVETDFTKNSDFSPTWKKKGDKNCIVSSAFNCSLEGFKKGAEVMSTEKDNMCKELDPCSEKYVHKNEGGVPGEKELPIDKVPETSVALQILHADSHKKSTLTLQNIICQESECKTSTWETRTDSSRTCSITAGEESKGLNRLEAPEENSVERSENAFDVAEQNNESKEKDCPLQKVQCVKCSECVAKLRKELRASTRIVVDALETGAIVDAGDQLCELHSTTRSGNTATGSHLKPDAGMDMDIHCEIGSSPNAASEKSGEVEEDYPKDYSTLKRRCTLLASENTDGASEFRIDNSTTGWMNDSKEDLLETGTSKGSPVMLSASKNRLPLCQMLTTFSEAYKIAVKHSKLNTKMLALGNVIEENYSEKFESNVQQKLPHSVDMDISIFEEYNQNCSACNSGEHNANLMLDGLQPSCCFSGTTWKGFLDNGRKNFIVKYFANPALSDVDCNSQMVNQAPKTRKAAFEDSCMLESESCVDVALKKTNTLKCKGQEQSEVLSVSTKAAVQVVHGRLSKKLFQGKSKTNALEVKVTEPVLANADTSMPSKSLSETINKIRQEMGPPLPPLLLPLIATPPRATTCSMGPVMSSADRSSLLSPLDELISPLHESPVPPLMSPLTDTPTVKSALLFSSPSPSEMAVGKRILSSPLQFCTSIPKHALPVPGRLPLCATDGAAAGAPQENSVKILDTMYPELSARARTLNILKGNIQLNLCALSDSQSSPGPVAQIGSFKTIASTSTAFVKTGSNLKSDGSKDQGTNVKNQQLISSSSSRLEKRTLLPVPMPRSAKRLRLDSEPPKLEPTGTAVIGNDQNMDSEIEENSDDKSCEISDSAHGSSLETSFPVKQIVDPDCQKVDLALKKIAESCFDLLPVIQSHLGNISKIPIMRDEEKEVVNEFGIKNRHLAESLLHVILNKLKAQKMASTYSFNQALCRVYAGVCRQLGDLERARLFCYSLLKEDFPDSVKLIIFITNIWPDIFFFQGAINKAMQLIIRQNANDSVLACLNACLSWEQGSSSDAGIMVSNLLLEMQSCPKVEFQLNEQYGEDLSDDAWQYIFAIDLLCSHLKWDWTHDNVISKVLWPSMDKWIKKRKDRETAQSVPDGIIALTLRLIGRLGQIGLKEGYLSAVKNISSVIGLFVQHAKEEDVPWGVQLAAIYSLCDLGSSNPSGIVGAIHAWRATVLNSIPFAVTRGLAEVSSLCKWTYPKA